MCSCWCNRIVEPLSTTGQRHRTAIHRIRPIDITSRDRVATESQPPETARQPAARRRLSRLSPAVLLLILGMAGSAEGQEEFQLQRRFPAPEARQAVAVDQQHFYAITNARIGKYRLDDGEPVGQWTSSEEAPLQHLNSGVIHDGRLYCAHSNYPHVPESSSVEIWDAATLQHVDSHSFGIYEGSLTWIDWKDDAWWAVFASYSHAAEKNPGRRDTHWTSLVKFDRQWRRLEGWVFPDDLVERFEPYSCSGGAWGPDGALYCTGHDRAEVYRLQLPQAGSVLRLTHIIPAPIAGQGIAWSVDGRLLGIHRKQREVLLCVPPQLPAE